MQRNQTTKKLCFLQTEMFTFKMVSTKTKCITIETKLKDSGCFVTLPVSLANFTFYDGIDLLVQSGKEATEILYFQLMMSRGWSRWLLWLLQSFVSVVVSNLKPTVNVLYPACQTGVSIKEFILGKHGRIRVVLKVESGFVVLSAGNWILFWSPQGTCFQVLEAVH